MRQLCLSFEMQNVGDGAPDVPYRNVSYSPEGNPVLGPYRRGVEGAAPYA